MIGGGTAGEALALRTWDRRDGASNIQHSTSNIEQKVKPRMHPARLAPPPQIKAAKNRGILTAKLASQARHDMDAPNGLFALRIVVAKHAKERFLADAQTPARPLEVVSFSLTRALSRWESS